MANIGKTQNKGVEISLNGVILDNYQRLDLGSWHKFLHQQEQTRSPWLLVKCATKEMVGL
jgi:outer membrane receptor protein involved in Fe transport